MVSAEEHYDKHLGKFYSWMIGEISENIQNQKIIFQKFGIVPRKSSYAVDLGCGNGIQSIALADLGFSVCAIDFNDTLLSEFRSYADSEKIHIFRDRIENILKYADKKQAGFGVSEGSPSRSAELIVCGGDTVSHLESFDVLEKFIEDCASSLCTGGKFFLSFRDYSEELKENARFISVKNDESRILTCFLEYFREYVSVTDILYEKKENRWDQKISSYRKLRISVEQMKSLLLRKNFRIEAVEKGRMNILIGAKTE